jgi:CubicO group peptidase (beta-lactamase class C family)
MILKTRKSITHRFTLLYLLVTFTLFNCEAQSQKTSTQNPAFQKIDKFMTDLETSGFSGSVLVSTKEGVFKKGVGLSDRENNVKFTTQTISETGSVTKQFTGAAILKLEMQGKLSVQDKMSKYIKGVPTDKSEITLHHLLTHSSGLPPAIGDDYEAIDREAYVARALKAPLAFQPGTAYEYSNTGYSILAAIIEQLSGKSYEAYLSENLFEPAGMKMTGYQMPKWDNKNVATGYRNGNRWGRPTGNEQRWAQDGPYWNLRGNGGILSTVEDLQKWHEALLTEKILSKAAKEKYYGRHIEEGQGAGSYYGYGWASIPTARKTWALWHNGGNGVFFCDFYRYLDEGVTIIVQTNALKPEYRGLGRQLALCVFKPDHQPALEAPPTAQSGKLVGLNEHPQGELIQKFLKAITSGNDKDISSFVESSFTKNLFNMAPMDKHLGMLKQIGSEVKRFEIAGAESKGEETFIRFKGETLALMLIIVDGKIGGVGLDG